MSTPPLFHIGNVPIHAPTSLAPMAALTDTVFRRMVKRQGGCGFVITEMVAAKAFLAGCKNERELLRYAEEERPIGGQIMGASPALMAEAARVIEGLGFDFVDINMGCPARKVVSGGGGSALMRTPAQAAAVVAAIQRAITIPVTVKLRAGWDDSCLNAPEVAHAAADAGAAMVSVHARTRADQYRTGTRNEILERTRAAVSIPVIANGDIRSVEQAHEVMRTTGCDGVMAGRGAVANPWLLRAITTGETTPVDAVRSRQWIEDHFAILQDEFEPRQLLSKLKTFSGWYTRGLMQGAQLRERINTLRTAEQFSAAIEEFFTGLERSLPTESLVASHQENRP